MTKDNTATILEQIEDISKRPNTPPPFHLFQVLDEYFVYDTTTGRFLHIDEPTSRFLERCLSMSPAEAERALKKEGKIPAETLKGIAREVKKLMKTGLLQVPDYSLTPEEVERQLARRFNGGWNQLALSLAETCNLACRYCYCATSRDMPPPEIPLMTEEMARQSINWLFAVSGKSQSVEITLFGGEPLTNKPVLRFVIEYSQQLAKLHDKKVHYIMTTNATLVDDEIVDYIKRYNFGLMVSLDGPKEIHDRQCPTQGGRGSYDDAAAGVRQIMRRRKAVTVRATLTHPMPRLLDQIAFFEEFGFSRIVMGPATNPHHPTPVDFTEEDFIEFERQETEDVIPWMVEQLAAGKSPKYFPYSDFFEQQDQGNLTIRLTPLNCGACHGTATLGTDGALYPCHRFVGMKNWRLGTMDKGVDVERCKQFWRDFNHCIEETCRGCWLRGQCAGPCSWEIAQPDGSFQMDPEFCRRRKRYAERAAYVYLKKQLLASDASKPQTQGV